MPIAIKCSQCSTVCAAPDNAVGKMGRCTTCGTVFQIPFPEPLSPAVELVDSPSARSEILAVDTPHRSPSQETGRKPVIVNADADTDDAVRNDVPGVMVAYGWIFTLFGILAFGGGFFLLVNETYKLGIQAHATALIFGIVWIATGIGLVKGQRWGVVLLILMACLSAFGVVVAFLNSSEIAGIPPWVKFAQAGCVSILYLPPLASALGEWENLE